MLNCELRFLKLYLSFCFRL